MATPKTRRLHPRKGQVIIFEQRSTHRGGFGGVRQPTDAEDLRKADRILVSLGFGLENNYTDEFEEGTKARQRDQCGSRCDRRFASVRR